VGTQVIEDINSVPGLTENLARMMAFAEEVGYAYIKADNKIHAVNQTFLDIINFPKEENIIGMAANDALSLFQLSDTNKDVPFDPALLPDLIEQSRTSGTAHWTEMLARTNDGRRIFINSWFNGDGEFLTAVRDVSEDRKQRRVLDMALKAANAGYWSLNYTTGKYTYSQSLLDYLPSSTAKT